MQDRPAIISADAAYDAREIRQYNRKRGIKSNIPVNRRSRRYPKHPKRGRPFWFDPELYKKRSAIERFFSWIEASEKIVPRYKRYEHSFILHSRQSMTSHIKKGCISTEIPNGANFTGKCSYTRYALTYNDE